MLSSKKHTESDTSLLAEMRTGSRTAFDVLYEKYKRDVYAEANKRLHDPELAQDITQDVFIALWVKGREQDIANLPGYLFISIRNKVLRSIARMDKFVAMPELLADLAESNERPDQQMLYKELLEAYEAIVNNLPDQQRIIYKMRYTENRSPEEIAELMNLSPKTVRNLLGKALASLKSTMMIIHILIYLSGEQ